MKTINPEDLINEAACAAGKAYCPYSKYTVGAALLTIDGTIFHGCNIENASSGLAICAERTAIFSAIAKGYREFSALAIVAGDAESTITPCGACLQVMTEFGEHDFPIYTALIDNPAEFETHYLGDLLPNPFKIN